MDLQEFSSLGPAGSKPWLVIANSKLVSNDANAVSTNGTTGFGSTTLTNVTPTNLVGSLFVPAELCEPGMAFRVKVYARLNNDGTPRNISVYLSQDPAGAIALTPSNAFSVGNAPSTAGFMIELDVIYGTIGPAGSCSVFGNILSENPVFIFSAVNSTTASTDLGVQFYLMAQWGASGVTMDFNRITFERLR